MDNLTDFYTIISYIKNYPEGRTLKEINMDTGINFERLIEIFTFAIKSQVTYYWNIELYNGDECINYAIDEDNEIAFDNDADEDNFNIKIIKKYININTRVVLVDNSSIKDINDFTYNQRWAIYDLFNECNVSFADDVRKIIIDCYENEFGEKYKVISKKRIIKQIIDVFDIDENLFIDIYKSICRKRCLDVCLDNGVTIYNISPVRLFYDDDTKKWYFEYITKGNHECLRFDRIKSIKDISGDIKSSEKLHLDWGSGKNRTKIKLRVYNEKNAKEKAIRFLMRKNIINEDYYNTYSDFTVMVSDIELFKRWAREMGAQVVILEPESLRYEFVEYIKKWISKYA